jgi:hypothetical protein
MSISAAVNRENDGNCADKRRRSPKIITPIGKWPERRKWVRTRPITSRRYPTTDSKQIFVSCDILSSREDLQLLNGHLTEEIKRMNRHPWIKKYGIVAVLLMLLLVMNLELRAFLLLANFIGLDLMIFFFVIQLRNLLPAIPSYSHQMRSFLCVASYTTLRVATRTIALLLAPARVSGGLTTLLFALSKNMWCAEQKQNFQQI